MEFCDMASVPKEVIELIELFERNIESYKGQGYKEARVRQQFINPFFEALGWDMQNKAGIAPAYTDVILEDAIKVGAPDYCFRIGPAKKFFVEAKKPSVDIKSDISPAYQLRRYAWSAKLPLSILTDFEEFAVYDCQIRPNVNDKPSTARVFYCTYKEYSEKWEQIAKIFGKEAVYKGLFDTYASEKTTKRGTTTVDKEFLSEIEGWRNELAKNIAIRNGKLSVYNLNFAVQKTIDRILFLRICEDRGIERNEQLSGLINGSRIYPRLFELFEKADEKYNSGIFHFRREKDRPEGPDEISANLKIDDDVLKKIIRDLYYPCPYEFSQMPAEILGQVYEQFLGKVIRLTESHQAKVEEKPEVKKAGGVYYTPEYIVNYIVQNTVGKLCENKTPRQIEKLKILDPACGSGSFLIGAYQYLLDYHRDYYAKEPSKHKKVIYQGKGKQWFLTIDEKKRILLNNIYGVDIDTQAAEVTKLSLLLKVLENETQESLRLFHERALPDLGNNIKCGNSLIGHDFYQNQQLGLFGEEEKYKINAFDWQKEFAEIFSGKNPGFDAVIGNPPYISVESVLKDITEYYLRTFKSAYGRANSFSVFLEKALDLTQNDGFCGLITSNRILTNTQLAPLRKILLENSAIENILTFKKAVFKAAVDTTVITFQKTIPPKGHKIEAWFDINDLSRKDFKTNKILQTSFFNSQSHVFNIKQKEDFRNIIQNILSKSINLEKICDVKDGIILGGIKDLFLSDTHIDSRYEKWLEGNEVSRYHIKWKRRYICYDNKLINEELKRKHGKAKEKAKTASDFKKLSRSGIWLRNPQVFRQEKILTRQNAKRLIGVFDESRYFVKNSLHCILLKDKDYNLKYILGLINSRLMDFYFQDQIGSTGEIFSQMKIAYIEKLPSYPIDFKKADEVKQHDKMVLLVDEILELHKKLAGIKNPDEKTRIQRQIDATDAQIDKLVYDLYDLTADEIAIVEGRDKTNGNYSLDKRSPKPVL
jgi:type I restriction-modification system DNA methylase subunit